jgi:hypothetical protein
MDKTKMTRRTALAISAAAGGAITMGAAAAQACAAPAAAGAEVDPIFALIGRHRAAAAESERRLDLLNVADACGCNEAEAALHAADKVLSAAQKALAGATAMTFAGLHALARYAVELRKQEDELYSAEECTSWYLLPAIERSVAALVGVTPSTAALEIAS